MKEKQILLGTPKVQAILAGKRTMIRQVIKPQPPVNSIFCGEIIGDSRENGTAGFRDVRMNEAMYSFKARPRYRVGDILWVRETWCNINKLGILPEYYYRADPTEDNDDQIKWKPPASMPREAARIFLEVIGLRCEHLQDITINDIEKEGITLAPIPACCEVEKPKDWDKWTEIKKSEYCNDVARSEYFALCAWSQVNCEVFQKVWDSTNSKPGFGWKTDPWVWAYEFRRVER